MNNYPLYLSLCSTFFDLEKPVAHPNEYAFYLEYVSRSIGPILEPMCGTGRYFIPMIEEGHIIDGFDASPFMLNALKQKCATKGLTPHVWEEFLENVSSAKKYDLIFIPDSSFCLFLHNEHIKGCLKKIYSLLHAGGIFVFDIETVYSMPAHIGIWQGKAHTKENGEHIIFNMLPLPIQNNIATVVCRYELVNKKNIIKTEVENFQIRLYGMFEMDALLKEVGFSSIKRIKTYTQGVEPGLYDHTIAYECIK